LTQARRSRILILIGIVLLIRTVPAGSDAAPVVAIVHAPPGDAVPGVQVYLTAVLLNATSATVAWRNGTMVADATAPMTNLSRPEGAGWAYAAYLPAQPSPTLLTYTITAVGPSGSASRAYALDVGVSGSSGLTEADQIAWGLTFSSFLAMAASVVTLLYWYTGRRLRRGPV